MTALFLKRLIDLSLGEGGIRLFEILRPYMAETLVTYIVAPAVLLLISPTLAMLGKLLVEWAETKLKGNSR